MTVINRRTLFKRAAATTAALSVTAFESLTTDGQAFAKESKSDSLPMQLYKSLSDEQRTKICLPVNHSKRQFISNWWYVHKTTGFPIRSTPNSSN